MEPKDVSVLTSDVIVLTSLISMEMKDVSVVTKDVRTLTRDVSFESAVAVAAMRDSFDATIWLPELPRPAPSRDVTFNSQ